MSGVWGAPLIEALKALRGPAKALRGSLPPLRSQCLRGHVFPDGPRGCSNPQGSVQIAIAVQLRAAEGF